MKTAKRNAAATMFGVGGIRYLVQAVFENTGDLCHSL